MALVPIFGITYQLVINLDVKAKYIRCDIPKRFPVSIFDLKKQFLFKKLKLI